MIGVFIYEFLSIHPYQDGNGRLSRLLTNLLLMKLDYKFVLYVSLESIIETQKANYYQALMSGQRNRYKTNEQIEGSKKLFIVNNNVFYKPHIEIKMSNGCIYNKFFETVPDLKEYYDTHLASLNLIDL